MSVPLIIFGILIIICIGAILFIKFRWSRNERIERTRLSNRISRENAEEKALRVERDGKVKSEAVKP